jgi:SAM-dependent methyltransferase
MKDENYHRDEDYRKNETLFANIFEKKVNLISQYVGKGKMLEIGSATGVMLELFRDKGWKVSGVEPSGSYKEAEKKKLKIIHSKFEEVKLPNESFDLVVLNHTLEHFRNPSDVIKKINLLLKKGGIIFIDVPNFGSLSSRFLGKKWPFLLPEEHRSQFTRENLGELLHKNNFKILHWESRSGFFEYANPFKELKRKRFLLDILLLPYSLIATLFKMGDSMSFIARKE